MNYEIAALTLGMQRQAALWNHSHRSKKGKMRTSLHICFLPATHSLVVCEREATPCQSSSLCSADVQRGARCSLQPASREELCRERDSSSLPPQQPAAEGKGGGAQSSLFFYCIVRCRAAAGRHTAARCSPSSHNTFASACLCDVMCRSPLACPGHP